MSAACPLYAACESVYVTCICLRVCPCLWVYSIRPKLFCLYPLQQADNAEPMCGGTKFAQTFEAG